MQEGLGRAGAARGFEHRALLDVGDRRRHADQHPRPLQARDAGALEQQADHALRDLEVGDRAAAQRADGDDVAGRAPDHLPRLVAHREHVVGAAVQRDDGRLVEDDALAARVDERVGGAEVDGEVAGQRESSSADRRGDRSTGRRCPSRSRPPSARASRSGPSPSGCRCRTAPPRTPRPGAATTPRPPPRFGQLEVADAVQERDPVDLRPAAARLGGHRARAARPPPPRRPRR